MNNFNAIRIVGEGYGATICDMHTEQDQCLVTEILLHRLKLFLT